MKLNSCATIPAFQFKVVLKARGNGKVVNARLADAKFFWDSDLVQIASDDGFDPWIEKLDDVTFHAKLGTQGERVQRIMALSQELASTLAANGTNLHRSALLFPVGNVFGDLLEQVNVQPATQSAIG